MPKGLRTLAYCFDEAHLTHFSGLVLLQRFCQQLRLRWLLQRDVLPPQATGHFQPADLLLALIYVLVAGLKRVSKTSILQYDGAFLSLLGLERFPDPSSLRRFLQRLSPHTIRQWVRLHDRLRAELDEGSGARSTLLFDLDAVVLTLYGRQEKARLGYNPKKKGRRSYHPLLCFEAHGQEFWHGSLRPGDTSANTGVIGFLQRCAAKLPGRMARARVRLRADAGFFGGKLLGFLEENRWGYVIVSKQYRTIRQQALAARFQKLGGGWEAGEFFYQAHGWPRKRRFVVVRRPVPEDPEEAAQLRLLTHQRYAYSVMVTNLKLSPWRVWLFYVDRARVEKTIRELLYDLPLGQIPTGRWLANVAFFQTLMLAYNLVHWFKRLCLPKSYANATVETVRRDFLAVPGRLVNQGHRHVLHLPRDYPLRAELLGAAKSIQRLHLRQKL
jgi:hypothetical protein